MTGELMVPMARELVWARVMRPKIPLVYLDLNHIIGMARVQTQHPGAEAIYGRLFDSAQRAASEQRAVFPLSESHVWEIAKITDPKQREVLVDVVEPISRYQYMLGRTTLANLEFTAGIAAITGECADVVGYPLIRPTIGHAFGFAGGLKIVDKAGVDATDDTRRAMGAAEFDREMAALNLEFERHALRGPADDEIDDLRERYGYRPEVALASHESRVAFERETARLLDENPQWRRGRLRDVVGAREFAHEWLDMLTRIKMARIESGQAAFEPTSEQMRNLMSAMPHTQVAISIKTRFHQNSRHVWKANHVTDIDAISAAYAYCDVVFTDKEVRNALLASRELRSLSTFVPRRVADLADWLDKLPTRVAPEILVPHPPSPSIS
ncbi:hypothetical protein ACIA5G_33630 [Amycolatopsis sp. NPDC051758]|uniref:hypothetical protein n=1 Tax=Amycolatopsis sp. NPDC051758 TaxID=3363935 RepID=UPI003790B8CC